MSRPFPASELKFRSPAFEEFEEKHPEIAKLFNDEAHATPPKVNEKRSKEIASALERQTNEELSQKQKLNFGRWLLERYDRIGDGAHISSDDIAQRYATKKWSDSTKVHWREMRMLKKIAGNFQTLALSGESAEVIEREDVFDLIRGAKVTRTPFDVTSRYPDGGLHRHTKDGTDYILSSDGSKLFTNQTSGLSLPADGKDGHLWSAGAPPNYTDVMLQRGDDDVWRGKDGDDDVEVAVDEHSVSLRSGSLSTLMTSKGGYIRDESDPNTDITIHADSSITIRTADEGSADLGISSDGTIMALSDQGREIRYPLGVETKQATDGRSFITFDKRLPLPFPSINVAADGSFITVDTKDDGTEKIKSTRQDDGTDVVQTPDGTTISRRPDKSIVYSLDLGGQIFSMTFFNDGKLQVSLDEDSLTLEPPELHRSKPGT